MVRLIAKHFTKTAFVNFQISITTERLLRVKHSMVKLRIVLYEMNASKRFKKKNFKSCYCGTISKTHSTI